MNMLVIVAAALLTIGAAFYLRRVIRHWETEDEFYDRWEFGGWADEVSDPADEALR